MRHSHPAVTLNVRTSPETQDQFEKFSDAIGRAKSFLVTEAIESYIGVHAWQIEGINQAVKKADSKKAKFISHEQVERWLNSWA